MKFDKNEKIIEVFRHCRIGNNATDAMFLTNFFCYITDKGIILEPEERVNSTSLKKIINIGVEIYSRMMDISWLGKQGAKLLLGNFAKKYYDSTIILPKNSTTSAKICEDNMLTINVETILSTADGDKSCVIYLNFNTLPIVTDALLAINSPDAYLHYHDDWSDCKSNGVFN